MGFVGQNGAGKTTTIKLILNMLKRENGEIKVFGKDNVKCETEIKDKIGVVLDNPFYVDEWKLATVEKAQSSFYSNWNTAIYEMKLMIAVALSHGAELLILDEPTSGLDAVARDELLGILMQFIADENHSVLFSTHITADLEKIADCITFIKDGKIVYSGTKDTLQKNRRL